MPFCSQRRLYSAAIHSRQRISSTELATVSISTLITEIAAQTPNGLMVPVVRHAEALDVYGIADEIARVSSAAKSGKASKEELSGSTITITSLGTLGGLVHTPVINHPEVAIVGVNRIVERPMLRGGQVVGRLLMNLSSSFDHRVVDGMHAAQFIQAMRALLETPALLFVE